MIICGYLINMADCQDTHSTHASNVICDLHPLICDIKLRFKTQTNPNVDRQNKLHSSVCSTSGNQTVSLRIRYVANASREPVAPFLQPAADIPVAVKNLCTYPTFSSTRVEVYLSFTHDPAVKYPKQHIDIERKLCPIELRQRCGYSHIIRFYIRPLQVRSLLR